MGNKIITEKDFWICSTGCVPAPFQGTASRPETKSGDTYITERDTSTASFIDFGCSKYMWIAALAAAAVVVGAIVVGVLTVATGGAALLVIGAIAGAAGAVFGGVVGALLCGQQLSGKRIWEKTKNNFKIIGTPTITGDSTMTCAAGGKITYAPNIKNWWQAISLATANYLGEVFNGMMIGATVGAAGMAYLGGAAAYAAGGLKGVGSAALRFLASTPKNLYINAIESVSKVGLAMRGVGGGMGALQSYGQTGQLDLRAVGEGVFGGEISAYKVVTGQGSMQDVWGVAMMLLPVGQGKRDIENSLKNSTDIDAPVKDVDVVNMDDAPTTQMDDAPASKIDDSPTNQPDDTPTNQPDDTPTSQADDSPTNKADDSPTSQADDSSTNQADDPDNPVLKNTEPETPTKPTKDGQAFEADTLPSPEFETITLSDGRKVKRLKPNFEYEANGYKYKTDAQGRIIEAEGSLKLEKGKRNPYAQRTSGKGDGRLASDQGGHLFGDQFGGAGGKENLVPMDSEVNNYHKGEWGKMEKNWAQELKNGNTVDVKIEPRYGDNTIRPTHFDITETISEQTRNITIFN